MKSNFIRPVRQSGGTLYIFNSATEDLNFLINESDERAFTWSKFVLLDIPDELRPTAKRENYIQYDAIPGAFEHTLNVAAENKLAESFQNYCLNMETRLLNDPNYEEELPRTVSERVFFKWLKELGALRFRQADSNEKSGNVDGARFTEERFTQDNNYRRVVQYVGNIDMVNSNKYKNNSYSEVYIHVPISHGNTKTVLFNTIDDENYSQNKVYQTSTGVPVNDVYLYGRTPSDNHPLGLNTLAFYDSPLNTFDTSTYTLRKEVVENDTKKFINGWFYNTPFANSYVTSNDFSDQHNDRLRIAGKNQFLHRNINVLRSRLDGITLDFNEDSYYDIVTNPSINSFSEYNQSPAGSPFSFNAVMIYYDVFEKANPENKTSNLFGVLFLNKPTALSGGGSSMSRLQKFKPNPVTGDNGNAWGLKVNLKLDTSVGDTQIETIINEYNTYSMELFLESMSELKRVGDSLDDVNEGFVEIKNKIAELEDFAYRRQNINELKTKYEELQNFVNTSTHIFNTNEELVALIQNAFTEINNIYANKTSIDVAYNIDVLDRGFGIRIDNINRKKRINVDLQEYGISDKVIYSIVNDFGIINNKHQLIVPNNRYTQLIRVQENGYTEHNTHFNLDKDIDILIDDTINEWQLGKKLRISFGTNYDTQAGFNINIYTDALDRKATGGNYGIKMNNINIRHDIFTMKSSTITGSQRTAPPIIELTCIDAERLIFITEIF